MIFILYKKIQSVDQPLESDIEPILNSYLKEIKEENKKLQALLVKKEEALPQDIKERSKAEESTEAELDSYEKLQQVEDQVETSLHAKVLSLYEKGLSVDEIAKQLKRGKTETELILKFHANN